MMLEGKERRRLGRPALRVCSNWHQAYSMAMREDSQSPLALDRTRILVRSGLECCGVQTCTIRSGRAYKEAQK